MIKLTRKNGETVYVNPDLVGKVEKSGALHLEPGTAVSFHGEMVIVTESPEEVARKVMEYKLAMSYTPAYTNTGELNWSKVCEKELYKLAGLEDSHEGEASNNLRFPRQPQHTNGWTIDTKFIQQIEGAIPDIEDVPSWEHIEAVLLALESLSSHREDAETEKVRTLDEWHEDYGDVLWWKFPIVEPPFLGTPIDVEWPGYHTHWTIIPIPGIKDGRDTDK